MWMLFVVIGCLAGVLVFLFQRDTWSRWIRAPLVILVLVALAVSLYVGRSPTLLSDLPWHARSPYREMALLLAMLMGMSCRYVTSAIEDRRDRIRKLRDSGGRFKKPSLEFDAWEFSYPLFASVVTFGSLLNQVSSDQISMPTLILSFQNGFFWQTLLQAPAPSKASPAK